MIETRLKMVKNLLFIIQNPLIAGFVFNGKLQVGCSTALLKMILQINFTAINIYYFFYTKTKS